MKVATPYCLISLAVFALMLGAAQPAPAVDVYWNVGTGPWNVGSNWLGGSEPGNNDAGNITNGGTAQVTAATNLLNELNVGGAGGVGHLEIVPGGSMNVTGAAGAYAVIGRGPGSSGSTVTQTGGAFNVSNFVNLGDRVTATYDFSGGTFTADSIQIGTGSGGAPNGILNQSGSTIATIPNVYVGNTSGSEGNYNVSGGQLDSAGVVHLGQVAGGKGTITHSNGTINVPNDAFRVGMNGEGIYNLSGTAQLNTKELEIARNGSSQGTVNQTGGTVTVTGSGLRVFIANEGTADYNMSAGQLDVAGIMYIGSANGSEGTLTMSGGQLDVGEYAHLGDAPGSKGTLTHSGGTINFPNDVLRVGRKGEGIYNVSGTAQLNTRELEVARDGTSQGTVNQTGGTVSVTGGDYRLVIGNTGPAAYNMSGGQLDTNGTTSIGHGSGGNGTVTQSGGTFQVGVLSSGSGSMVLGYSSGSDGTYSISGNGILNVEDTIVVGRQGAGRFEVLGDGASINARSMDINATGTMGSSLTHGGVSPVALSSGANFNSGTVDVDLLGGAALLTSDTHQLMTYGASGGTINSSETLWDAPVIGSTALTVTLAAAALEDTITAGSASAIFTDTTSGYVTVNSLSPTARTRLYMDVNVSGQDLADLLTFMTDAGLQASPSSVSPFDLEIETFATATLSHFAWDFADYAAATVTVSQVAVRMVPEPSALALMAMGLVALLGIARRRR